LTIFIHFEKLLLLFLFTHNIKMRTGEVSVIHGKTM